MPAETDTDALLDAFQAGDLSAQDRLFARHRDRLRRMVTVHFDERLGQRLDPSDVVQETLAEAARRLPQYAGDRPIAFFPWLRQIAWDRLIKLHRDHLRAERRAISREESWQPPLGDQSVADLAAQLVGGGSSPSLHAVRQEVVRRVREAIDGLAPAEREIIVLRYLEQLTVGEIAAVLGTTEGAVRGRQFRAIQKLHARLEKLNREDGK